jgi:DNA-binding response OmpR family regulator
MRSMTLPADTGDVARNASRIILGVDDQPENVAFLKMVVEYGGYTFFGAASGTVCLNLIHRVTPRLILLDVEMPAMDGFETCRRLRQLRHLDAVPIAFLTARKTVEDVRRGISAGGNDFIVKPAKRDELLGRISHWSGRKLNVGSTVHNG